MLAASGVRFCLWAGLLFLIGTGLAGCGRLAVSPTPTLSTPSATQEASASPAPATAIPSPTQPVATQTASPTTTQTAAPPSDTPTPFPITLEPEESPTPKATLPAAAIQILSPGPLSKVNSPINGHIFLEPGAGGRVRVELFGEDGRLLYRQLLIYPTLPGRRVNLFPEIEFEIAAVAETARLAISIDDRWGRTFELASTQLVLLSSGLADVNPSGDLLAPLLFEEPLPEAIIDGGEVLVVGLARTGTDQPLVIELVTREGKVVGSRLAAIAPGDPGEHRPFAVSVPYEVDAATRVLLVVRERGMLIPGNAQLTSIEIILQPE